MRYQKIITALLFILILSGQLVLMGYMGSKKDINFIDEIWSFNLANSQIAGLDASEVNSHEWLDRSFWRELLTPSEKTAFGYKKVIDNQIKPRIIPRLLSFIPDRLVEIGFESRGAGDCSVIVDADGVVSSRTVTILINHIHGKRSHYECVSGYPVGYDRISHAVSFASQLD